MAFNVSRHPALEKPQTPFEWTVAELDQRLDELRTELDESDGPANRLTLADPDDISAIKKRWKKLPDNYVDFLTRFSPLDVSLPVDGEDFSPHIVLFGAAELIERQVGYSVDESGKPMQDWPKHYVVIACLDADPFVLDLSGSNGNDASVLTSEHGQGSWDFDSLAESFMEFLDALADPDDDVDESNADERIEELSAKIRRSRAHPLLYFKRGMCLAMIAENKRAVKDFNKAIELGMTNARAHLALGDAYFDLDQFEEAIAEYTTSLKHQKTAEAFGNRGEARGELDRYPEAIADLTRAIELDDDDADYWYNRGESYWFQGDEKRAEPDLTRAILLSDGDEDWLASCYVFRGGARCDTKRPTEALKDLNRAVKLDPDSDTAFAFRGNTYVQLKKYGKALTDYEQCVELDSDDAYNLAVLAWLLATCPDDKIRDGRRALELAKQAVKQADGKEHLEPLAAAQAETGKFADAVKTQEKAIKLCDDRQELKGLRNALECYKGGRPNRNIGSL